MNDKRIKELCALLLKDFNRYEIITQVAKALGIKENVYLSEQPFIQYGNQGTFNTDTTLTFTTLTYNPDHIKSLADFIDNQILYGGQFNGS